MLFRDIEKKVGLVILKGLRDAFKRTKKYQNDLKSAKVTQPRYKQDGTRHKIDSVFFKCEHCLELFKQTEVQLDHIEPVIPTNDTYLNYTIHQMYDRIFNGKTQVLCKPCHKEKTRLETNARAKFRRQAKNN